MDICVYCSALWTSLFIVVLCEHFICLFVCFSTGSCGTLEFVFCCSTLWTFLSSSSSTSKLQNRRVKVGSAFCCGHYQNSVPIIYYTSFQPTTSSVPVIYYTSSQPTRSVPIIYYTSFQPTTSSVPVIYYTSSQPTRSVPIIYYTSCQPTTSSVPVIYYTSSQPTRSVPVIYYTSFQPTTSIVSQLFTTHYFNILLAKCPSYLLCCLILLLVEHKKC